MSTQVHIDKRVNTEFTQTFTVKLQKLNQFAR